MYAKGIQCRWSRGCVSSPSGHQNHERFSLIFNGIRNYVYDNNEDYVIEGLHHAQRILEKTLGKVDGYQTDDGISDHKDAINAVKKLNEQKSV